MNVLIDFFESTKTFEIWNLDSDKKHYSRDFKSEKAAVNYCIKNKLNYKFGLDCDG